MLGYHYGGALAAHPERVLEPGRAILAGLADCTYEAVVDSLPLEHAADAHRRLENRETVGKLVLRPDR